VEGFKDALLGDPVSIDQDMQYYSEFALALSAFWLLPPSAGLLAET
jgi:hypothetical protein